MPELSVLIPNRNSPFTQKTIEDILANAGCDVQVIVNVDENWPDQLSKDPRVTYIHPNSPIGMRAGINACAKLALGKYIMKSDDHCAFGKDFGRILIASSQPDWVQVPSRYALDAENWKREDRTDNKYPISYMYQDFPRKGKANDDGTHGVEWRQRRDERYTIDVDETPAMQGSCWFMEKAYFDKLNLMDETGYGKFAQEAQEIGFKTWLSGGKLMVNKLTWYAHLHKGQNYGRFYKMPSGNVEADSWSAKHWLNTKEYLHDFDWFINEKFPGMPGWPTDWKEQLKGMGWYEN